MREFRLSRSLHYGYLVGSGIRDQNRLMRFYVKSAIALLVCGLGLCGAPAQQPAQQSGARGGAPAKHSRKIDRSVLTQDDRLSIIAAALDPKVRRDSAHDCSHLVHAIYERAGFPYVYASSDDLYGGVEGFRLVTQPQTGDIIVWPGHAGIVVRPSHHVFFSFLTAGPGIDDYHSRYWIGRGEPRFYRYVKRDHCAGCTSVSRVRPTR